MQEINIIGCLLHTPQPGTEPATQARALMENQTGNILLRGTTSNQLNHTHQGYLVKSSKFSEQTTKLQYWLPDMKTNYLPNNPEKRTLKQIFKK